MGSSRQHSRVQLSLIAAEQNAPMSYRLFKDPATTFRQRLVRNFVLLIIASILIFTISPQVLKHSYPMFSRLPAALGLIEIGLLVGGGVIVAVVAGDFQ
jgi:hypothetical protein